MLEPSLLLEAELTARPLQGERRIAVRFLPDQQTSCQMIVGLENRVWQATIRNLSECGIGLLLNEAPEPGSLLALELENPAQQLCRTLLAVAIYAKPDLEGNWLIGCQFANLLTREELQAFCELKS